MALNSEILLLAGLIELALPGRTVRLTDGGFVNWPARGMFVGEDPEFGAIGSVEAVADQVGDEAPAGRLTLLPPSIALAASLFRSDAQGSAINFWLAEVNRSSGLLVGTPELQFSGLVDTLTVRVSRSERAVDVEFMSDAERLFMVREGNVLSTRFHQTAWPGEKGFDHCTGAGIAVPWGVPGPARGSTSYGGLFGAVAASSAR